VNVNNKECLLATSTQASSTSTKYESTSYTKSNRRFKRKTN